MIEAVASRGKRPLPRVDVYRVNRQRLAKLYGRSPGDVDTWSALDYYDALDVQAADDELNKLGL